MSARARARVCVYSEGAVETPSLRPTLPARCLLHFLLLLWSPLSCMYIYSSSATRSPANPSVNGSDVAWRCAVVVTTSRSPRELFSENRVATLYAPPPPQPPPPPPIRTISIYVRARTDGFSFAATVLCPVTACQIQYISTRRTRR